MKSKTLARPCIESIGVRTNSLDWISHGKRTRTRARTQTPQTHTVRGVSKCGQRGKIGTGRRQDGWAGSVSNYRLLITPSDPPFVVLRRNSRPYPRLAKVEDPHLDSRNDSINNASSAIALNMYPVSSESGPCIYMCIYIERNMEPLERDA